MLVLTRKLNEKIVIGDDGTITLTVLEIRGGHVRLGIEAPNDIAVNRQEVFDRKSQQRESEQRGTDG